MHINIKVNTAAAITLHSLFTLSDVTAAKLMHNTSIKTPFAALIKYFIKLLPQM